jgi:hypothetical protein
VSIEAAMSEMGLFRRFPDVRVTSGFPDNGHSPKTAGVFLFAIL